MTQAELTGIPVSAAGNASLLASAASVIPEYLRRHPPRGPVPLHAVPSAPFTRPFAAMIPKKDGAQVAVWLPRAAENALRHAPIECVTGNEVVSAVCFLSWLLAHADVFPPSATYRIPYATE